MQGAPDCRPLFIYLILFTSAVPRIKCKGLPIDISQVSYYLVLFVPAKLA
jgi:hypothetical protein